MGDTFQLQSETILGVARSCGLTALLTLCAMAVRTRDRRCPARMKELAAAMCLHRSTVAKNVASLTDAGFVVNRPAGRGRVSRQIVETGAESNVVWLDRDTFFEHVDLADAFALALVLAALAGGRDCFTVQISTLLETAGTSRNTLKKLLGQIEAHGLAKVERVSWTAIKVCMSAHFVKKATEFALRTSEPIREVQR